MTNVVRFDHLPDNIRALLVSYLHFEAWPLFRIDCADMWIESRLAFSSRFFSLDWEADGCEVQARVIQLIRLIPYIWKSPSVQLCKALSRLRSTAFWELLYLEACKWNLQHDLHKVQLTCNGNAFGNNSVTMDRRVVTLQGASLPYFSIDPALPSDTSHEFSVFIEGIHIDDPWFREDDFDYHPEMSIWFFDKLANTFFENSKPFRGALDAESVCKIENIFDQLGPVDANGFTVHAELEKPAAPSVDYFHIAVRIVDPHGNVWRYQQFPKAIPARGEWCFVVLLNPNEHARYRLVFEV